MSDATLKTVNDMEKKVKRACMVVENQAKQDCPVDLGILRASITSEVETTAESIVGRIGSNEEYAPYVHNGTGIYAVEGDRKTPWKYQARAGRYKGWHITKDRDHSRFFLMLCFLIWIKLKRYWGHDENG